MILALLLTTRPIWAPSHPATVPQLFGKLPEVHICLKLFKLPVHIDNSQTEISSHLTSLCTDVTLTLLFHHTEMFIHTESFFHHPFFPCPPLLSLHKPFPCPCVQMSPSTGPSSKGRRSTWRGGQIHGIIETGERLEWRRKRNGSFSGTLLQWLKQRFFYWMTWKLIFEFRCAEEFRGNDWKPAWATSAGRLQHMCTKQRQIF